VLQSLEKKLFLKQKKEAIVKKKEYNSRSNLTVVTLNKFTTDLPLPRW